MGGERMRGADEQTGSLFSYVSCEARVPASHPLRRIRVVVDESLQVLSPDFDGMYAQAGRPSIAPEKLLRALLLQAFYSIRSERQMMEQLDYNLLFRWFVGLSMDAPVWDASTFSKNRERFLAGDVAQRLLAVILASPGASALMSDEHFSVDGTLIRRGRASKCSSRSQTRRTASRLAHRPKGPPGRRPIRRSQPGERLARAEAQQRDTCERLPIPMPGWRASRTGRPSILAYAGHVLMENRNGLVAQVCLTQASGTAEREAALTLLGRLNAKRRITLGADKGYDAAEFIAALRSQDVTPHIAADRRVSKTGKMRRSAIDGRTTRHPGYELSQRKRKRIEEVFGWVKASAGLRQTKHRGQERVGWLFTLATTAYNLIRLPKLLHEAAA